MKILINYKANDLFLIYDTEKAEEYVEMTMPRNLTEEQKLINQDFLETEVIKDYDFSTINKMENGKERTKTNEKLDLRKKEGVLRNIAHNQEMKYIEIDENTKILGLASRLFMDSELYTEITFTKDEYGNDIAKGRITGPYIPNNDKFNVKTTIVRYVESQDESEDIVLKLWEQTHGPIENYIKTDSKERTK